MNSPASLFPLFLLLCLVSISVSVSTVPDFVIVGAGTSGCALAARLCVSLPSSRIVLLERGLPRNASKELLVRVPRFVARTWSDPSMAEIFPSAPNPGLQGRVSGIVTGNTLGGSSSLNGMQWTIPLGDSVDRWGILGLSSAVAQTFYRKAYNAVGFSREPEGVRPIYADDYVDAARKTGFKEEFAPFDQTPRKSIWRLAVAIAQGRRVDSCTAYLTPVLEGACSGNLELRQSVSVTKVLLSKGKVPRATGVEYVHSADTRRKHRKLLRASKEVILAAGPFGSPKLLQLSGIGPKKLLANVGLKTRVDLEVGQKTQARAFNSIISLYTVPLEPSNNSSLVMSSEELRKWEKGEDSVLATTGFSTHAVLGKIAYMTQGTGISALDVPGMQSVCIMNPTAFGSLRIRDGNAFSVPEVETNILGEKEDLDSLQKCMDTLNEIHGNVAGKFGLVPQMPEDGVVNEAFLRATTLHGFHFVGGCRVGSVVGRNLKVRGVKQLRVVDASVLKSIPTSAGPLASTYMLAEYAAERIAEGYKCAFRKCTRREMRRYQNGW